MTTSRHCGLCWSPANYHVHPWRLARPRLVWRGLVAVPWAVVSPPGLWLGRAILLHHEAHRIFYEQQHVLEHEPGIIGMRLFDGEHGGMVWRNKEHRDHYERLGFYPSPTLPWVGVMTYFTPRDLRAVQKAYRDAFASNVEITRRMSFSTGRGTQHSHVTFLAIYGNVEAGVVLTRSQPCACRR